MTQRQATQYMVEGKDQLLPALQLASSWFHPNKMNHIADQEVTKTFIFDFYIL